MPPESSEASLRTIQVVVPCFNEAERLRSEAFVAWLAANPEWHLRFVDDGSSDGTADAIRAIVAAAGNRQASLQILETNQGKAEAVRQGLLAAIRDGAEFVGFFDADLATPLDDLIRLLEPLRKDPRLEMAMGSRIQMLGRSVRRRIGRHYAARGIANLAALALDLPVHDTQCGAKLMRNSAALRSAVATPFSSRWVFDMELIQRIGQHVRGHGIADPAVVFLEVPVSSWTEVAGSKVRFVDAVIATTKLWGIYRNRRAFERTLAAPTRVVEIEVGREEQAPATAGAAASDS